MNQWPAQSDASHTLELMELQLTRVAKEHACGQSTDGELVQAHQDAFDAWEDVVVEAAAVVARATRSPRDVECATRVMMRLMGVGRV